MDLASDEASFITAQVITVDGGRMDFLGAISYAGKPEASNSGGKSTPSTSAKTDAPAGQRLKGQVLTALFCECLPSLLSATSR
jgi:hypothetical protein